MTTLATIWMLAYINLGTGEIRQMGDYKARASCEAAMTEGMQKGLALRCIQTSQVVTKAYLESLK